MHLHKMARASSPGTERDTDTVRGVQSRASLPLELGGSEPPRPQGRAAGRRRRCRVGLLARHGRTGGHPARSSRTDRDAPHARRSVGRRPVRRSPVGRAPVAARSRSRPRPARRRPAGAAAPAGRGAAQRLPADADDRGAQRRRAGARAPARCIRRCRSSRTRVWSARPSPRRAARSRSPTPAVEHLETRADEPAPWDHRRGRTLGPLTDIGAAGRSPIGKAAWQVATDGDEAPAPEARHRAAAPRPGRALYRILAEDPSRPTITRSRPSGPYSAAMAPIVT